MNDYPFSHGQYEQNGLNHNTYANIQPYDLSSLFSATATDTSEHKTESCSGCSSCSSSDDKSKQYYPYRQEHKIKHEQEHKIKHEHHQHKSETKIIKNQVKDDITKYHMVQEVERIKLSEHHLIKSESVILAINFHGLLCEQNIIEFYLHRLGRIVYLRWNTFSGIIPAQGVEYIKSKQNIPYCEERQDFPIVVKQATEDIITAMQLHHIIHIKLNKTSCKDQYIIIPGSTIQWLALV